MASPFLIVPFSKSLKAALLVLLAVWRIEEHEYFGYKAKCLKVEFVCVAVRRELAYSPLRLPPWLQNKLKLLLSNPRILFRCSRSQYLISVRKVIGIEADVCNTRDKPPVMLPYDPPNEKMLQFMLGMAVKSSSMVAIVSRNGCSIVIVMCWHDSTLISNIVVLSISNKNKPQLVKLSSSHSKSSQFH